MRGVTGVELTFLYGNLVEEIHMECLQGIIGVTDDNILLIIKRIYRLIKVVRQYHKKCVNISRKIVFKEGDVDPCIVKKINLGFCFVAVFIDSNLLVGDKTMSNH